MRLDVLEARIAVFAGEPEASTRLRQLAVEAQAAGNPDLAAEVWRAVADTVAPP
jgi:hypothetical protein